MNRFTRTLLALALVAGLFPLTSLAAAARTDVASDTSVTSKTSVSVTKEPVLPIKAPVSSYIQLNNLVVQSVTYVNALDAGKGSLVGGGAYAYVTASTYDACAASPVVKGQEDVPCIERPTILYTINVFTRTQILDVNRKPMSLDKIQTGDRINTYGRQYEGGFDAEIIRDLDRNSSPKATQINDLRVGSVSTGKDGTVTLEATMPRVDCVVAPCLMKASVNTSVAMRVYTVTIPRSAQVVDANRNPIKPSTIRSGDIFNVYGMLTSDSSFKITAQIVRVTKRAPAEPQVTINGGGTMSAPRRVITSFELHATGGTSPYTWELGKNADGTASRLPRGMKLTTQYPLNCLPDQPCAYPADEILVDRAWIAGKPSRAGTYKATLIARDAAGRVGKTEVIITITR